MNSASASQLYADAAGLEPAFVPIGDENADVLEALLIIVGHGVDDGQVGTVEEGVHCAMVAQWVLQTTGDGVKSWREFMSPHAAAMHLRRVDDV